MTMISSSSHFMHQTPHLPKYQYDLASLVAQTVKSLPAMWETLVRSLGWENPLEKEMATHSSILAWRIPWRVHEVAESDVTEHTCPLCTSSFPYSQLLETLSCFLFL